MHTAVIYARFSCSKQREASIEDQLRVCRAWCAREGYEIVAEYCDYAISGRTDERPQFQAMMEHAGESEIVLVYMMDRFSRDAYDAPIYKKRLRDKGVRVFSATEAIPDGPEAILIEKLYEGLAAVESAHIAERTRRGMEGNALKCMHNGVPVYGYRFGPDGLYEIEEKEAEVVREVFARRVGGECVNSIADSLALRGVKTTTGKPASYTFVHHMLKCEKYTGVYIWGDVRIDGGMPLIVGRDDWAMAQEIRSKKIRSNETWDEYALSGKTMCEICGENMIGVSGRGRGGAKYRYYQCLKKCLKAVRADWLEDSVAEAVRGILGDDGIARDIARIVEESIKREDEEARLADARHRRAEAEKSISNLVTAISKGLDPELANAKIAELKIEAGAAIAEEAMLENAKRFDTDDFVEFLRLGATFDDARLFDAMVHRVIVGERYVTVVLNYHVDDEPAILRLLRGSDNCASGCDEEPQDNKEPAKAEDSRVLRNGIWLPNDKPARNVNIAVYNGAILMRFKRAS